jgi:hypothetical protein
MKRELLEHDYMDLEILYHGQKPRTTRTEELMKQEKDLLDETQVKEIIDELKKEGVKEYTIMEVQPGAMKKAETYKKILFYINIPLIIGIPAFVEFGLPEL